MMKWGLRDDNMPLAFQIRTWVTKFGNFFMKLHGFLLAIDHFP